MSVTVYSDGGTNGSGNGAGATILDLGADRYQVVSFLGKATNNEGEIFSGLVGFYLAQIITGKTPKSVHWVSDSQYAIKSATQYINNWISNGWRTASKDPVKNQGLWRSFLALTQGTDIQVEHVKGHSGHEENEACDLAVNWIRDNLDALDSSGVVEIGSAGSWIVFDAREAMDFIRNLDSGVSRDELFEYFKPIKDALSGAPREKKQKVTSSVSKDTKSDLKEITKGYIQAVRDLKDINDFLKSEPELKKALMFLKKWSG